VVFSSPLLRARHTAELAGFPEPVLTDLLREVDYGEYESLTSAEILASRPGWDLFRDGCPGGEAPAQVRERARAFLELALSHDGDVLVFSHGHFLRAIAVVFSDLDMPVASRLGLDTSSVSVLEVGEPYGRRLLTWNWTAALPR
jgi:probable phosphoglycerate mutase